ncbi:MAG TPA: CocE/NonD family hydrolase [Chloroflexia bacterium]|nr:CocE/NonD family hydrolase [Chloroflexia bacterium]
MSDQIKVEFDVEATMRDGTVLRANVFRPAEEGSYPVALTRTPYGKDFASVSPMLDAPRLARAGYIVVIQDVRGRYRSEGEWVTFANEANDGYDTVEWAAQLPGSNGKVGMFGASYFGFTQWIAAAQQPPHLKAIVPSITWADVRDGTSWRGGAFELGLMAYWHLATLALDITLKRYKDAHQLQMYQAIVAAVNELNRLRPEGYYSLPLKDFEPLKKLDLAVETLEQAVEQPFSREASAPYSIAEAYDKVQVPSLNIGGWYDIFTNGVLQNFNGVRNAGGTPEARQTKLIMGPWSHVNYSNTVGDIDFGFGASMALMNLQTDLTGLTQRWFDYWLKGIDNGIMKEAPVKLFVMGDNAWRDEQEWPLARTVYTPYYFHSQGRANTLNGNGFLSTEKPGSESADHFTYDPANPVHTYGGGTLMNSLYGPGVKDQRSIEERDDVLVFTSEVLGQDTEVTGPISVKLWASTDGPDTDFVARLVDVHPDGFAQNLADGIIRARYRNGDTPELLEPGQVYEFNIDLWSTANVFKAGHRIRVDLTSSNFPRWDRNHNTGEPFGHGTELRPARQTILHDAEHPSHVLLPIIPR